MVHAANRPANALVGGVERFAPHVSPVTGPEAVLARLPPILDAMRARPRQEVACA
jgi:hypothetical protein